jgi:fibronectin type 3 domain-containing protein
MKTLIKRTVTAITALSVMAMGLVLAGCGSGGGLSSEVVSGTAAVGAPLSGQVSLKDSSATPQQKTTVIGNDGTYAFDVTGMKAPFILQATGSAAGTNYKLHSFADGPGTANINPLSDVIVASAAEVDNPSDVYERHDSDKRDKIRANLPKTVDTLLNKLQPLLERYGATHTNPITSRYIANHLDLDEMFDNVKITVKDGILSIIYEKTGAVIYSGNVSDIANGNFYPGNLPPAPTAPAAPAGLSATGGAGQVTIAWAPVSNATSYNVYYSTASGVTTTTGTKLSTSTNNYVQTGLTAGTTYYYIVTALNIAGESAASAQVQASTNAAPPVPSVPAAPTGVSATGGTKQATISWPSVSGATSYNIYWSNTSGVTTTTGTKIAGATSPAVQSGLSDSTTYYYIVTAVNAAGESAASVQVAATTLASVPAPTAPAAPTGVSATGSANMVTLTWSAVAGATSYNIYWSNATGVTKTNGTKIAAATSPYIQTGLSAGAAYYYVVTAVNSVGESVASTQATATTSPAPPAVPVAPAGVSATGGANQVSVSWSPVSGATSYNLYWSKTSGVTTATGTKITAVTSPYVQTGLTAGSAYYYIVTAVNTSGEGPASAQASASTNPPAVVIPAAPAGVTATGGANQVTISWPAVTAATSYNIYYSTTSGVTKANGSKITNAASPYLQTGLAAGTTYYYIVTAQNSAGEGAASAQATATTNAPVPPPTPTCGSCHSIPPSTGQHSFHVGQGYSCQTCHGTGYSSTSVNAATHANGTVDVVSNLNWNGTSCAPACHGRKNW